jgi:HEAT repeat protein
LRHFAVVSESVGLFWRRPPKVERLKKAGDVDGLVRALHYEDPITDRDGREVDLGAAVREDAAAALSAMEGPAARDGLARALRDPEESVRIVTVRALGQHRGSAGLEPLVEAVATWTEPERSEAREEAVAALAEWRDPYVPRRVAAVMLTRPIELQQADVAILRTLADAGGPVGVSGTIEDLLVRVREDDSPGRAGALLVALAPESLDDLVGLLDEERLRETAAFALGSTHDSRAVEPLSAVLRDQADPGARRAAAWALGEIRDPAGADALLVGTTDPDYDVRLAAITAFDKLGNAAIAVAMSALLRATPLNGGSAEHARAAIEPALESIEAGGANGSAPSDETAAQAETVAPDAPATPPSPGPTQVGTPVRTPFQPGRSRTAPVLRRLLGR